MATFSSIIGQEHIKEHLQRAILTNKISHAYVISGEKGAGKEFIANTFAMALQCEKGGAEPCMECHSCRQAVTKNQPDIITLTHEKPNTIGVEDVRGQIVNDVMIKPYSSKWKIYIVNDGEKMSTQAQNALLKTLEEPPIYVVILILTSSSSLLLETIVSRCTVLNMRPVEDKTIRRYLMETLHVPDYQADICVAFARGNIGKAKSLATSEEFENIKREAITVLKYIHEMEIGEFLQAIKKISEYKMSIDDYLDIMTIWYRDVLLFKATNDLNDLVFKEEVKAIKERANQSAYEGIEIIIKAIEKTKVRLNANVNFDLAMELLMLTIKEN
ncbi:MAG: DNA polymerase III subunit delta [Lachnospiraceae bacterium]